MLRTLFAPETYLNTLIQEKRWEEVIQRLETHPLDAKPNHSVQRGISPSSLACAVRGGAKVDVLIALIVACPELIAIKHYRSGTILHDAAKYKCSAEILLFLTNEIIQYEQKNRWISRGELKPIHIQYGGSSPRSIAHIDEGASSWNRLHTHDTMFNQNDDLGRTPLHCLMYRAALGCREDLKDGFAHVISKIVTAFPPAVGKKDGDGFTPLDITLTTPKVFESNFESEMELELRIFRLCNILIQAYPNEVWISSFNHVKSDIYNRVGSPFQKSIELALNVGPPEFINFDGDQSSSYFISKSRHILSNSVQGTIALNPVSRALLHDRHISTIELLTEAIRFNDSSWHTGLIHNWNEKRLEDVNSTSIKQCCTAVVTRDFEVNMHLAVTMRCSSDVLKHLIRVAPESSLVRDRCGFTPIDWLWMRFIADLINLDDRMSQGSEHSYTQPKVKISSRRILPNNLIPFMENQSLKLFDSLKRILKNTKCQMISADTAENDVIRVEEDEFRTRLNELLPVAAKILARTEDRSVAIKGVHHVQDWKPLHAAAFMNVPRYVLLSAILVNPNDLMLQDSAGNLPLHYAAARSGYEKILHIGVTSEAQKLIEKCPVFDLLHLCPDATEIANQYGQLPLHIAIEKEKRDLMRAWDRNNTPKSLNRYISEDSIITIMSRINPASLEHKDGLTGLYPFMQAATEDEYTRANLSTIYALLLEFPSLVQIETVMHDFNSSHGYRTGYGLLTNCGL